MSQSCTNHKIGVSFHNIQPHLFPMLARQMHSSTILGLQQLKIFSQEDIETAISYMKCQNCGLAILATTLERKNFAVEGFSKILKKLFTTKFTNQPAEAAHYIYFKTLRQLYKKTKNLEKENQLTEKYSRYEILNILQQVFPQVAEEAMLNDAQKSFIEKMIAKHMDLLQGCFKKYFPEPELTPDIHPLDDLCKGHQRDHSFNSIQLKLLKILSYSFDMKIIKRELGNFPHHQISRAVDFMKCQRCALEILGTTHEIKSLAIHFFTSILPQKISKNPLSDWIPTAANYIYFKTLTYLAKKHNLTQKYARYEIFSILSQILPTIVNIQSIRQQAILKKVITKEIKKYEKDFIQFKTSDALSNALSFDEADIEQALDELFNLDKRTRVSSLENKPLKYSKKNDDCDLSTVDSRN